MSRKAFLIEKSTKVSLRGRYNTTGELTTLYLDWGSGKNREFLFIPDRIYTNPKTDAEKEHNKIILSKAKKTLSLKNVELLSDKTQLKNKLSNVDFITFAKIAIKLPTKGKIKKSSSQEEYINTFNSMSEMIIDLNNVRLNQIDKSFVQNIQDKLLNSNLMKSTAWLYYSRFSFVLNKAVKEGYIDANPCLSIDTIPMSAPKINYLFHEDIIKLKETKCKIPVLKKAGLFSSQTGMRSGDMKELRWKKIIKVGKLYQIVVNQQKTDNQYIIHFRQEVMDILGERGDPDDLVFPGLKNDTVANAELNMWLTRAGVQPRAMPDESFSMHDFRHTFAITLGLNGVNLYEISKLLGHASIKTTELYYARVLDQMKQKIVLNMPLLNAKPKNKKLEV